MPRPRKPSQLPSSQMLSFTISTLTRIGVAASITTSPESEQPAYAVTVKPYVPGHKPSISTVDSPLLQTTPNKSTPVTSTAAVPSHASTQVSSVDTPTATGTG